MQEKPAIPGFGEWIVVAISFRSNDPNQESNVRRFFERENAETLKRKAFLSTRQFSQIPIHTYFPPRDEGIGAKFVFPRSIDGAPIVDRFRGVHHLRIARGSGCKFRGCGRGFR